VTLHSSAPDPSTPAALGTCPACGATLVRERQASPWCERCGWGIDRYDPEPGATRWQRRTGALAHTIAYRLTLAQFRQLSGAGAAGASPSTIPARPVRPPRRWGAARFAAVVFAIGYYAALLGLIYVGVQLVLYRFPNPTIAFGLLLLGIAMYIAPRPGRLGAGEWRLRREDAPTLFALIDRTAAAVGTRPPAVVAVEPWFNAATTSIGLRQRRVLILGLALWGCLDPQQRLALLAHELGHFKNGDIRRGPLIWPAMTALRRLSGLFTRRRTSGSIVDIIVEPIVNLVMRIVSVGFYAAHLGVMAVLLRDSQRREYLADHRAAQLAGSRATVQLMDLLVSDVDSVIASRARARQTQVAWREAAATALGPDRAATLRRLRQLSTRHDVSLWTTHPPAGLRAWLIEASARQEPTLVLSDEESVRIDAELEPHYQRSRRDLAQSGV
jgi:Zn-dependent protease with chaperone function